MARIDHAVQATLSTKAGMPMRVLPRQRVASAPRIGGDIRELFEAPAREGRQGGSYGGGRGYRDRDEGGYRGNRSGGYQGGGRGGYGNRDGGGGQGGYQGGRGGYQGGSRNQGEGRREDFADREFVPGGR